MESVRALYDFNAESGTTELSISTGEVLTVLRRDVGEGWLEGSNSFGTVGLFPAAYVEPISSEPPKVPPPPFPTAPPRYDEAASTYEEVPEQGWGNIHDWPGSNKPMQAESPPNDEWDDDWDEDSETGSTHPGSAPQTSVIPAFNVPKTNSSGDVTRGTIGKKSFNRFSSFVKSGGESYVLGSLKVNVPEADRIRIYDTEDGVVWDPIGDPYSCIIASPKKESKLKGLKSFIAYQLTPSFNNIQVSRRYKHFDWLHERLEEKFSIIPIPPLPDKQISGRYEEQFIEHRRVQLQAFVNCVCRHPVLSKSAVWKHFITCTDDKQWKIGKRRAEKDEIIGAKFFLSIEAPDKPLELFIIEQEMDDCNKFVLTLDASVKNLIATSVDQTKKHQGPYKREYQRIGHAFHSLGHAFGLDKTPGNPRQSLTNAIQTTADIYNEVGKMFEEQPRLDWEPLGNVLHIYKGIISSFPDILNLHKNALNKSKECDRLSVEGKMSPTEHKEVKRRTNIVSYALMSEMNHFHSERAADFKIAMQSFLQEQIRFYQNIVDKLHVALTAYDQ